MNLKQIRQQMGLTQKQLGRTMGMRQEHISRLETGTREMTLQQENHLFVLVFLFGKGLLPELISTLEEKNNV